MQGLTKRRNGGRNSIKKQINKQALFSSGWGAGSGLPVLVSHWEREGSRDVIGGVSTEGNMGCILFLNLHNGVTHSVRSEHSVLFSLSPHTPGSALSFYPSFSSLVLYLLLFCPVFVLGFFLIFFINT